MLSLPLAKLSVALDTDPDAHSFTWQHDTHDLTFVIDSYGSSGSSQLLKVVQGTQVRQIIEVQRLISEGEDMMRAMQQRGVSLKPEQLPISAIVRCPLLAIRWQLPNQKVSNHNCVNSRLLSHFLKVRRVQIKFKSNQHYDAAYSKLHQLGLRMAPSNDSQAGARPYTPSLASRGLPHKSSLAAATVLDQTPSGALSCPPSHLADFTSRPFTASDASVSTHTPLQEVVQSRPFSALPGYNYADSNIPGPSSGALTPPVYFARPSSATTALLQQSLTNATLSPRGDSFTSASEDAARHSGSYTDVSMPSNSPHSIEASLPPRRELPFQRSSAPPSPGSDTIRPPSRPYTGLMGPPPLPVRVNSLRPALARDDAMETELLQLSLPPLPTKFGSRQQAAKKSPQPRTPDTSQDECLDLRHISHRDIESQRPSTFSPHNSASPGPSPSFVRMSNSVFSTVRVSDSPGSVPQGSGRATSLNTPATRPTCETMQHENSGLSASRTVNDCDVDGLRVYIMQSEDQRRDALNEFIFQHLENDNFLTLVEDMETCWARVALGMR
ncbi:hypothetical protein J1614_010110 [Plenodomus biglobosus]|nr:hypothetical protein J1614_010110 [Plenodomus biglobosus]